VSRNLRILLILMVLTVAASAIALGRWQLRRLSQRQASNAAAIAARALPPDTLGGAGLQPGTVAGRRVVAKGVFNPTKEILLRGRVQDQSPGLQVVTPLTLTNGDVLWVLRGFIRSPDAATPPERFATPDTGLVEVSGLAVDVVSSPDSGKPLLRGAVTTWARLDQAAMHSLAARSLPFTLQIEGDSTGPGRLPPVPVAELTNGPHLSYAIQWFGIALSALVFGVIFLRRGGPGSTPPLGAP
jgi:surfeit locus 1 family protein